MAEYYEPIVTVGVHKARFSLNAYTISAQTRLVHTRCDTIQSGCDFDPQGDDLCTETPHTNVVCQWSIKCIRCKVAAHKWLRVSRSRPIMLYNTPCPPLFQAPTTLATFPSPSSYWAAFPALPCALSYCLPWAIALATSTWRICTLRRAEATPLGSPTARARWQIFYSQKSSINAPMAHISLCLYTPVGLIPT